MPHTSRTLSPVRWLLAMLVLLGGPALTLGAAEKPLSAKQILADMAAQGSRYDRKALHDQGVEGLKALLDHLFPETVPGPEVKDAEQVVRDLIKQLGHDDFNVREQATIRLTAIGRRHLSLVEKAAAHDDPEVRQRAKGILAAWAPPSPEEILRYRNVLVAYLNDIKDADRLDLLTERANATLQQGMPKGERLDLVRQMLAAVAQHGKDQQWDKFIPLLDHKDPQVGVLVVNAIGSCRGSSGVFPRLLLDALDCGREPIIDEAISWAPDCRDLRRRAELRKRLRKIFETGSDNLKFHACFPLMYTYRDAEAFNHILDQTQSRDPERARKALYWVGDSCNFGRPVPPAVLEKLVPHLKSKDDELRRAAAYALGIYQGEKVVEHLLPLLGDPVEIIVNEVSRALLDQRDKKMLRRMLEDAGKNQSSETARTRAADLAGKIDKP